jgi:ribA/ribD-fused uncharacterized protein
MEASMQLADLLARVNQGETPEYLFFWGHRPAADGRVSKSCFSQWWPAPFTVDGVRYATAEHWMMAKKAELFGDAETRARIVATEKPDEAKALGRQVKGYDDARWAEARYGFVVEGNHHKFAQHPELAAFLRGTGSRVLVEASPVDPVWGIGLDERHEDAPHPARWKGTNLLGFALMEVRSALA